MDFSKVVSAVHMSLEEPVSLGAQNIAARFELPLPNNESLNNSLDIEADGSDDASGLPSDDLEECWWDMDLAMKIAKENEGQEGTTVHIKKQDPCEEDDGEEVVCVHDCKLDEQHGLVCQIYGLIEKKIDTIIEYQWHKVIMRWHESNYEECMLLQIGMNGLEKKAINCQWLLHCLHLQVSAKLYNATKTLAWSGELDTKIVAHLLRVVLNINIFTNEKTVQLSTDNKKISWPSCRDVHKNGKRV